MNNRQSAAKSGARSTGGSTVVDGVTVVVPRRHVTGLGDPLAGFLSVARQAAPRLHAGFGGFVDAASFGAFDPATAGVKALAAGIRGDDIVEAYNRARKEEADADRADAARYGLSRNVGQGLGTAASIAASVLIPGGAGARALSAGLRAGRIAPKVVKAGGGVAKAGHVVRLGGATGAVSGAGGQAASDLARGRVSSPGSYAAATLGGGLGGVVAPYLGARAGGAVDGAVSAAADAALNGRPVGWDEVRNGAVAGATIAGILGSRSSRWVNAQSNAKKEAFGELLSTLHAPLMGQWVTRRQQMLPLSGFAPGARPKGYTRADLEVRDLWGRSPKWIEAKFGDFAKLTERQEQAASQLAAVWRPEHWLHRDIGNMVGVAGAASVSPADERSRRPVPSRPDR